VRLLRAELRKLRRPLTTWTAVALLGILGLVAWGMAKSAADEFRHGGPQGQFEVGPSCDQVPADQRQECEQTRQQVQQEVAAERQRELRDIPKRLAPSSPIGVGALAAGMLATFPGAVALLLLAAGHVGNEWSGRTIKQVLVQEGRRWRVLAAKAASLWLAGVALLLVLWAGLALLAVALRAAYPVGQAHLGAAEAWRLAGPQAGRALLVLAGFVALGVLAAAITRNTLGAFFLAFAVVIVSLILSGWTAVTRLTLPYWVTGWMGFPRGTTAPLYLWRDVFPDKVPHPSHLAGLYGLAGLTVVALGLALVRLLRSDVKV
jgi:ABC-type transport system involved in multi-copper enzyme maturation permease subunit